MYRDDTLASSRTAGHSNAPVSVIADQECHPNFESAVDMVKHLANGDKVLEVSQVSRFEDFLNSQLRTLYPKKFFHVLDSNEMENYARVFISTQTWDRVPSLSTELVRRLVYHMVKKNCSSLYESIAPGAQKFVLDSVRSPEDWYPDVYLRTLVMLESYPERMIRYDNKMYYEVEQKYIVKGQVDRALEEILKNASSAGVTERLDLTPSSIEFIEAAISYQTSVFLDTHTNAVDLLTLWRCLYGERVVIEMLQRFSSINSELDQHDLMNVMDDWDTWRDYPVEWILETYSAKV